MSDDPRREYEETVALERQWWAEQDRDKSWIRNQLKNGSKTTRKPKWAEK